jgi:hypothetical protein
MGEHVISLARDFSRNPGPRLKDQGPDSGETFRKLLVRALSQHDKIVVDLDGTSGIGSSFLDEAFGGLVRSEGLSKKEVRRRVRVVSNLDSSYLSTVSDAIKLAEPDKVKQGVQAVVHAG